MRHSHSTSPRGGGLLILVLLGLSAVGCTMRYEADATPMTQWPTHEKVSAPVRLVLTPAFCAATHQHEIMGDKHLYLLGPSLAANTEALARQAFTDATVARGGDPTPPTETPVLIPTIANMQQTSTIWAMEEVTLTVDVGWTLTDRQGTVLWAQTVRGEGRKALGNVFTHKSNAKTRMKLAVEDAMTKSLMAITSAAPVRSIEK